MKLSKMVIFQQAEEVLTEAPFTISVEPGDELYNELEEQDISVILSGVIDLAYREKDGWVIVDYKTDRVEKEEELEKLREVYSNQVEIYARAWKEITGEEVEEVKEKLITFL
ncbi:MAG: ATP-dependent helicase/nuclease subunit [Halanaerobiales bacterium]|nr:ATP-dependent helicase/nuclease subunit [Halanaerobiales bacterium]